MWTFNISLLDVALRTLIIYTLVLTGIQLTGKREVGQMASYELVLILLLANAVQNAIICRKKTSHTKNSNRRYENMVFRHLQISESQYSRWIY